MSSKDRITWFVFWLGYCAATGLVLWAFGADLTKRGVSLGFFLGMCFAWMWATIACIADEEKKP